MTAAGEVRLRVRVIPRATRDGIDGVRDGELLVRVTAPPADGAANEAVIRLVARELGLPRGAVRLVTGARARHKVLAIDGLSTAAIEGRWPGLGV